MQLQRDVGIFRRVLRGGVEVDLVETDLLRALARHLGVGDGLHAEMAQREVVHVVRLVRFQHVGLQQGVFGDAAQGDAVVGEDVLVVFEVLPELFVRGAFQPGLEFVQRMLAVELLRCAGVVVRQRQVGGMVRLDGEGDAHQLARSCCRGRWFRCPRTPVGLHESCAARHRAALR